jgi:hypothetical protein
VFSDLDGETVDPDRAGGRGADDVAHFGRQEERGGGEGDVLMWYGALGADLGGDGGDAPTSALENLGQDWEDRSDELGV